MEVFSIKFNYVDMLNQFLTNIFILKTNLANLHFNVKGEGANSLHQDLGNDIDKINIVYDSLAELIKKIGGYPIMNLEEIKNVSTVKEISSKDYTTQDVNSILLKDLTLINSMNNQVGEYALKNYDLSSINLVLDFNKYLSKRIWFLKMDK